jgi:hypothetical protein
MNESLDLRDWLRRWPFDPENSARVVRGADGREVMQVRTPLGVEQYELEGRPDGTRPHDAESVLSFLQARHARWEAQGKTGSFSINASECAELFDEGLLYYFRYLHLFQLHDWPRVVRDTERNLAVFDFVGRYAKREQDRQHLEQWRPYVLRMHAVARAMAEWEAGHHATALRHARAAVTQIEGLAEVDSETFRVERERSLEALNELVQQIEKTQPLSEQQLIERELQEAVAAEQFERAAVLRDRLRSLRTANV